MVSVNPSKTLNLDGGLWLMLHLHTHDLFETWATKFSWPNFMAQKYWVNFSTDQDLIGL